MKFLARKLAARRILILSEGQKLLSKCFNPSCSAVFCRLHDGKVFVLESDPADDSHRSKRPQFFWLCHGCSLKMTLRLGANHTAEAILLSQLIQDRPAAVAVFSHERRAGMILRSLIFPQLRRGERKMRSKLRHSAA